MKDDNVIDLHDLFTSYGQLREGKARVLHNLFDADGFLLQKHVGAVQAYMVSVNPRAACDAARLFYSYEMQRCTGQPACLLYYGKAMHHVCSDDL